jgi:hypothetical protein
MMSRPIKPAKAIVAGLMTVAAATAVYAAAVSGYSLPAYDEGPRKQPDRYGSYHYRGAVHIHSSYSHDGSGRIAEIAAAAKNNDLDFAVVTDHNNMAARADDGYRDGVLIITGEEVSTDRGHFLALGLPRELTKSERHSSKVLEWSSLLGGVNVLSHPFGGGTPWTRPQDGGWDGLEIANLKTLSENAASFPFFSMALSAAAYPFNPRYSVLSLWRRPDEALAFIGNQPAEKRMLITCGTDAHGFPPYSELLGLCVNHILSKTPFNGDQKHDSAVVLNSFRKKHNYVAMDGFARADNFAAACSMDASGRTVTVSLDGFPKARLAHASVSWGGKAVGGCSLEKDCKVQVPGNGPLLIEVELTVPHVLWGTRTIPWIYSLACGD